MGVTTAVRRPLAALGRRGAEIARLSRASVRLLTRPSRIAIDGIVVPVSPGAWSPTIMSELYREVYEIKERRALAGRIGPADRVLEIGTAIGVVAAAVLRQRPAATLHYEPNPDLVAAAGRTLEANGLAAEIRTAAVVPDAVPGGSVTLHLGADFWSSSLTRREGTTREIAVPAEPFAAVLAEFRPTVIVMDVEGAECDLLLHPELAGVRTIFVELHRRITGVAPQSRMIAHLLGIGFNIDFRASDGENVVLFREAAEG